MRGSSLASDVPGREGVCSPFNGKPVHGSCTGDAEGTCAGSCDGTNRAACTYPDVECGAGSCAGGTATIAPRCNAGTCPAATTQTCALGCLEKGCLGVKQVAAGWHHACALLTDGKVRCWGENESGQTGQPSSADVPKPIEVPGITTATAIATSFSSTCALLGNGTVKCWGVNSSGELGNGTTDAAFHNVPGEVAGLTGVTFLGGSEASTYCAITAGGTIKCWGNNTAGQAGDGVPGAPKPTPVTVCAPDTTATPCAPFTGATFVVGGDQHMCAIYAGGKVACWGSNLSGQLGQLPVQDNFYVPRTIPSFTATYLTAGHQMTCAASTAGEAFCWGANGKGRLGTGNDETAATTPARVCTKQDCSAGLSEVTALSTFDDSTCALSAGDVKCWGSNSGGQLGDGSASSSQNHAATTAIAKTAVAVASGGSVSYAIVVDGANRDVRCWGNETSYQCGDGTMPGPRRTPVAPKW